MNPAIDELIEKWQDVVAAEDDWTIKNLGTEFIEDLEFLLHG